MDQYNFLSARNEVINRLGGRNDALTLKRATEWLNSAQLLFAKSYIELPRLHQVTTQVKLVANTAEYNLLAQAPDLSDIVGLMAVRNEDKESLSSSAANPLRMWRFPFREYRTFGKRATGRPTRWARHGNLFVVDPIPDDTYLLKIDYRRRPQFETLEIDSEWHEPLINCAVYYGWAALDQYNLAQSALAMLPAWLLAQIQTPIQEEEWEQYWDGVGLQPVACGFRPV